MDNKQDDQLTIYNCHAHVFTNQVVPEGFLPLGLMRLLRVKSVARGVSWFLRNLLKMRNDWLDRVAAFTTIGSLCSQTRVFDRLRRFYPDKTKFVCLPMDMQRMGAGDVPQAYPDQLRGLEAARDAFPEQVLPFVAVDPRRPGITDLVKEWVEEHGFVGLKLYPPLGYFPFDPGLDDVYAYALEKELPIIAHCSRGGVYYRGRIPAEDLVDPDTGVMVKGRSNAALTDVYTHPRNYERVLENRKGLRLCLAHYGGGEEWTNHLIHPWPLTQEDKDAGAEESWLSVISELIKGHDNVYADISFTMHNIRLLPLLKALLSDDDLRPKILFGTDFYMVRFHGSERELSLNLRAAIGERDFRQIAETNPRAFLDGYA